jgi:hypothetical protein
MARWWWSMLFPVLVDGRQVPATVLIAEALHTRDLR